MDQLRIPALALDHIATLRSEAERDRRTMTAGSDRLRTVVERWGSRLAVRRTGRRSLEAEPC